MLPLRSPLTRHCLHKSSRIRPELPLINAARRSLLFPPPDPVDLFKPSRAALLMTISCLPSCDQQHRLSWACVGKAQPTNAPEKVFLLDVLFNPVITHHTPFSSASSSSFPLALLFSRFLYELSQIPDFAGRAHCIIFQSVFFDTICSIRRKVDIISKVCKVRTSRQ